MEKSTLTLLHSSKGDGYTTVVHAHTNTHSHFDNPFLVDEFDAWNSCDKDQQATNSVDAFSDQEHPDP